MNKKFGVSVGLLSAIVFFAGYSSWLSCLLILVAVLCFAADDVTLKTNALSATVLSLVISIVQIVFRFLSNKYLDLLNLISKIANSSDAYNVISWFREFDLANFVAGIISIVYFIMTIVFMLKALKGEVVNVPVITNKIKKHLSAE